MKRLKNAYVGVQLCLSGISILSFEQIIEGNFDFAILLILSVCGMIAMKKDYAKSKCLHDAFKKMKESTKSLDEFLKCKGEIE